MKFFKNKFFISLLCISLVLCIFTGVLNFMGVSNFAKTLVGDVFSPIMKGVKSFGNALSGYSMYFSDIDGLIEENQALKDEIADLKDKLGDATLTEEENKRLRDYISVKESHEDFTLMEALIIGSESDNYMSIVKINRGADNGIKVNMPVIVGDGLVGNICEVGSNWANVRIICEASSGAGGYILRSGEIGVIQGDITYRDDGVVKLAYLDIDSDVQIGDVVYTSGSGSIYPGGLLIGKVSSVGIDEYSRSKVATVTCSVDFDKLTYVMIITGFDKDKNQMGKENGSEVENEG